MSASRFKSKDDYFSKRSGLAERVLAVKPPKPGRKRAVESAIPATLLRVHFCKTGESFEIEGQGRYRKGEYPLDDALRSHLNGEATVLINPLSNSGETAFTVVGFDISEAMDLPFSKARQYADELQNYGIPSVIEVAEGGKGHYHLWIFHEEPTAAWQFSEALIRLGQKIFGILLETVPSVRGEEYIPLPLQGESMLLQRRVFVNAVGKMIKDQGNVLQNILYCPKNRTQAFIGAMGKEAQPPVSLSKQAASPETKPPLPGIITAEIVPAPTERESTPVEALPYPGEAIVEAAEEPAPALVMKTAAESAPAPAMEAAENAEASAESAAAPAKEAIESEEGPESPVGAAPGIEEMEQTVSPVAEPVHEKEKRRRGEIATAEPDSSLPKPAGKPGKNPKGTVFLFFSRSGAHYAVEAGLVERIAGITGVTRVPGAEELFGTVESGGRMITVLDPTGFFGTARGSSAERGRIIALGGAWRGYGVFADIVTGPMVVTSEQVTSTGKEEYARGFITRPEGIRALLPDVGKMVARRASKPAAPGAISAAPAGRYMVFSLSERFYGIPVDVIREVLPGGKPSSGGGKMRLAGILPSVGAPASGAGPKRKRVLVLASGTPETGIPVDSIRGVRSIPSTALEPVMETSAGSAPIVAVARLSGDEGAVFILDADRMLAQIR
ncbi:MAG: chemotaxis protein CheW [Candidatus Latescibacterota bacterium]